MGGLLDRMYAPEASMLQDARNRKEAEELAYINAQKQAAGYGAPPQPQGLSFDPTRIGRAETQEDYTRLFDTPQPQQSPQGRSSPSDTYIRALIDSGNPQAMQRGLDMRERMMIERRNANQAAVKDRRIITRKSDGRQFYEDNGEPVFSDDIYNAGIDPIETADGAMLGTAEFSQLVNLWRSDDTPEDLRRIVKSRLQRPTTYTTADGATHTIKGMSDYDLGVAAAPGGDEEKVERPIVPAEGELKARGFADRMISAEGTLADLASEYPDYDPASIGENIRGITNTTSTSEHRKYKQAANDWIRAKLRKESGAVIGDEEMRSEYALYFPIRGDGPGVIEQKALSRQQAMRQMETMSGRAKHKPDGSRSRKTPGGGSMADPLRIR